jgi:hypothetical protein
MNNKRTIERIATIALAAFLVVYFVYQVAYGITIGSNGTYTIHGANGTWATFSAPPGTTLSNMTIKSEDNPSSMQLGNTTWTMLNGTHSLSAMKFNEQCQQPYEVCMASFKRILYGNTYVGSDPSVTLGTYFHICPQLQKCVAMKTIEVYSDHLVFLDPHGNTIHLVR